MKIQKKYKNSPKKRKLLIVFTSLFVTALILVAAFLFIHNQQTQNHINTDKDEVNVVDFEKPSSDQQDAGDKAKEDFNNSKKDDSTTVAPEKLNGKNVLPVTIININNSDPEQVSIRASVDTLEKDGTCKLVITDKNGLVIESQQSSLQTQSSYSSCLGFTVPKSKLANGPFKAKVSYESSQSAGTSELDFTL